MSLDLAQFKEKREKQEPKLDQIVNICDTLLKEENLHLVPYGSNLRSFLTTLHDGVSFLARDMEQVTDFGLEMELNNLSGLKGQLLKKDEDTGETVEKQLKDLFMKQKVYPAQDCFDALQAVDEYYEAGAERAGDPAGGRGNSQEKGKG